MKTIAILLLTMFFGLVRAQDLNFGAGLGIVKPIGQANTYLGLNVFGEYAISDQWSYALSATFTAPNKSVGEKLKLEPLPNSLTFNSILVNSTNNMKITNFEGTRRFFIGDHTDFGFSGHFGTGVGLAFCKWTTRLGNYDESLYSPTKEFTAKNQVTFINWVFEGGVQYKKYWGSLYANLGFNLPFTAFASAQSDYFPKESNIHIFTTVSFGFKKDIELN